MAEVATAGMPKELAMKIKTGQPGPTMIRGGRTMVTMAVAGTIQIKTTPREMSVKILGAALQDPSRTRNTRPGLLAMPADGETLVGVQETTMIRFLAPFQEPGSTTEQLSHARPVAVLNGLLLTGARTRTAAAMAFLVMAVPMKSPSALLTGLQGMLHGQDMEPTGGTAMVPTMALQAHPWAVGTAPTAAMEDGTAHLHLNHHKRLTTPAGITDMVVAVVGPLHLLGRSRRARPAAGVGVLRTSSKAEATAGTSAERREGALLWHSGRPALPPPTALGRTQAWLRTPEARRTTGSSRTAVGLASGVVTTAGPVIGAAIGNERCLPPAL